MCGLDAEKGGTRGERQNRTYVRTKSRSSANPNKAYSTEDGYCLVRLPLSSYMEWMTGPVEKGEMGKGEAGRGENAGPHICDLGEAARRQCFRARFRFREFTASTHFKQKVTWRK